MEPNRFIDRQLVSKNFSETTFTDNHLNMTLNLVNSELLVGLKSVSKYGLGHLMRRWHYLLVCISHFQPYLKL